MPERSKTKDIIAVLAKGPATVGEITAKLVAKGHRSTVRTPLGSACSAILTKMVASGDRVTKAARTRDGCVVYRLLPNGRKAAASKARK